MPLRLLYSRHNRSQIAEDELSTRIRAGSTQVREASRVVWMGPERSLRCVLAQMPSELMSVSCVFALIHLQLCPSPQREH